MSLRVEFGFYETDWKDGGVCGDVGDQRCSVFSQRELSDTELLKMLVLFVVCFVCFSVLFVFRFCFVLLADLLFWLLSWFCKFESWERKGLNCKRKIEE